MTDKIEQLNALSDAVHDIYEDMYSNNKSIGNQHHILYTGNLNAKIAIVKMHPNNTEVFWAKQNDVHNDFLFCDEDGKAFKTNACASGFKSEQDFIYINLIPFYNKTVNGYDSETLLKFGWIFTGLIDIIDPIAIVSLGYRTFLGSIANYGFDIGLEDFEEDIKNDASFYEINNKIFTGLPDKGFSSRDTHNIFKMLYNHCQGSV